MVILDGVFKVKMGRISAAATLVFWRRRELISIYAPTQTYFSNLTKPFSHNNAHSITLD